MINLLSAELYKLRKSKSFRASAGLAVLFTAVIYLFEVLLQNSMIDGVDPAMANQVSQTDILQILRQMFANCNTIIFATIFVCLFALGDYNNGAVKNFVGKGFRRTEIYLARFFVTECGAVAIYLLTAFAVLCGGAAFLGTGQLNGAVLYDFISYLSLQVLYLTGYTAVIIMICEITRNTLGIFISMLGVMLLSDFIFQGMDLIIHACGSTFTISKYWILTVIRSCPTTNIPAQFVTSSGMITGVWLVAALVAGILCFSWKDVK